MLEITQPTIENEERGFDYLPSYRVHFHHIYKDYPIFHKHNIWEFTLITLGSYKHVINGKEKILTKGDGFLIRPDDYHALFRVNDKPVGHINIAFQIDFFRQHCNGISPLLYDQLINLPDTSVFLSDQFIDKLYRYLQFFKSDMQSTPQIDLIDGLIINLIIDKICEHSVITNNNLKNNEWFTGLIEEINKIENAKWNVDDVLKRSNYSHAHLIRLFKEYTGLNISEYLKKTKIRIACELLITTDKSIQDISEILGYQSVTNFNPFFKKNVGLTPFVYRKNHK